DRVHGRVLVGAVGHRVAGASAHHPRTFGNMMNSHGEGIGPTDTSITLGPSRRATARRNAVRKPAGSCTRSAAAPKLSANRTKSGLVKSLAISRLPYCSC